MLMFTTWLVIPVEFICFFHLKCDIYNGNLNKLHSEINYLFGKFQ
jgi:hypothetical protein